VFFTSLNCLMTRVTGWLGREHTRGPAPADPGLRAEPPDPEAPFDPYATLTFLDLPWDSPEPRGPNRGTTGS
jgi:hypothetical protein